MDEHGFKRTGVLMQGFDLMDVVTYISKTNKKYQATLLADLERVIGDPEVFPQVRKLVLDSTNNYVRAIVKEIFGGIEV